MRRNGLTAIILLLASTTTACNQSPRYVFLSQNVAAAAAAGANEFSSPETETVRGAVYRLDTRSGEMVMVMAQLDQNAEAEFGVLSVRVFTPDETDAILSKSRSRQSR